MIVSELMTPAAECISPNATIQEAAARMKLLDVGALPVYENEELIGMITDRDITIRAVSTGSDPCGTSVRDVMTRGGVIRCFGDDDIYDAARLMEENQIRRLVVLDRNERLIGILSLGDLAVRSGDEEMCGTALEHVSEPARPNR